MDCFIKKIFQDRVDEAVHNQFVRFGKGSYEGRAVISLRKNSKVKLKGSFEFANDFVLLVSELANVKFSGVILSKKPLNLQGEKNKAGLHVYDVSEIESEKVREISDKVYFMLLDAETSELKLKIKKKLPKPGKSGEGKVNDKFCQFEADLKFYEKIKQAFFWDVPGGKKIRAEHSYNITELIMPEGEINFEKIRLKTKRKGKIIRKLKVDGREMREEKDFEV